MLPLLLSLVLTSVADTLPPDGPYLIEKEGQWVAEWAITHEREKGSIVYREENLHELPDFASFRPELVDTGRAFRPRPTVHYRNVDKVVALSDIHGQYMTGRRLLEVNGVIDSAQHWVFGEGHLVVVGDIFDRGDQVTDMLWLIHNLQFEAERVGGKVHFLLGNHETMILEGDDRYLNPRYRITTGLIGRFYKDLYGPDTYLGRWLRSLPLAVQINETIFVHGGISKPVVRQISSLERLNQLYHDYLIDNDGMRDLLSDNARMELLHGSNGPLWYRGYFSRDAFSNRDLSYVLRKLNAKRIVVGHTSFTAVQAFYDDRLIAVDSSIKFGSTGEMLIIEGGTTARGTLLGERLPLPTSQTK